MDDEKIKELAEQYVREHRISDAEAYYENKRNIEADDILPIIQWISERFCIVEKGQIYMRHGVANALMEQDPSHREFYRGQSSVLESIFGKELFNDTEK